MDPWARLVGSIKRITVYSYTQNMKALGSVDLEIFFLSPIVSLYELSIAMVTRVTM